MSKTSSLVFLLVAFSGLVSTKGAAPNGSWKNFSAQGYAVTDRGQNFCAWSKLTPHTNDQGLVSLRTNSIVHLSPGRAHLQNAVWVDSAPELIITNDAVLGRGALCTARFAANLNTFGATEITTAAGTLQLHLLGLAYQDVASGSNVWLGLVQDSTGNWTLEQGYPAPPANPQDAPSTTLPTWSDSVLNLPVLPDD